MSVRVDTLLRPNTILLFHAFHRVDTLFREGAGSVDDGEGALGGFFVEGGEIVACLLHDLHYTVEAHGVTTIGERRIEVCVKSAGSRVGVTFYTWNLHKAADRIAGEPQVMFKSHLGGIFYLGRSSAEQLRCSRGSHGASHSDHTLASYFGSGIGGVVFHQVTEQSCRGKGPQDALLGKSLGCVEVIKHGENNSA